MAKELPAGCSDCGSSVRSRVVNVDAPERQFLCGAARRVQRGVDREKRYLQAARKVGTRKDEKGERDDTDTLAVARHWNSQTPLLPESPAGLVSPGAGFRRGGGYFLDLGGTGVAIDPGHDFLHAIYEFPFCYTVNDIDVVIITHDHPDHTGDLQAILTLKMKANCPLLQIYANRTTARSVAHACTPNTTLQVIQAGDQFTIPDVGRSGLKYDVRVLRTFHNERSFPFENSPFSVGLFIQRPSQKHGWKGILITGDGQYPLPGKRHSANGRIEFAESDIRLFDDQYDEIREKVDLVCLHIGSVERQLADAELSVEGIAYDRYHLGFLGCCRLLKHLWAAQGTSPGQGPLQASFSRIAILTEFGEELAGNRADVAEIMEKVAASNGVQVPVVPADLGLCWNLDRQQFVCSLCSQRDRIKWHPILDDARFGCRRIRYHESPDTMMIHYYGAPSDCQPDEEQRSESNGVQAICCGGTKTRA